MKLFWLVVIVLAAPIVPAMLVAADWDSRLEALAAGRRHQLAAAATIGGLLAADIFLPTPSGPLAALAGARLGVGPAIAVVWAGLTGGAAVGFFATRRWGRPLAMRLAGKDLERMEPLFGRRPAAVLIATRPLPVLAEAVVLLAGIGGAPWRVFLPAVAAGNLVLAVALALVGRYAAQHEMLTIALAFIAIAPLAAAEVVRRRWSRTTRGDQSPPIVAERCEES